MHDIEPHFQWRDHYVAARDERSPFYGMVNNEFTYTNKIYNYLIHPQWDEFGSSTLYLKILFVDYEEGFCIMELIGEWNDCIHNDVMLLKRNVVDQLCKNGIHKYILICENVLNYHSSDDCYYEEWFEDVSEDRGWVCLLNTLPYVEQEMQETRLQHYINFGEPFNTINWRPYKPKVLLQIVELLLEKATKQII